ncbi:MAG: epoxyqueuosine reductase QueH [Erysipelotrichaceae bacterium]|nr:epoxyqueuosine reductase QueH [Erysipelotrichaceae bacterium]
MIEDYKAFKKFIESLDYKPRLLLHSCCAPCSSHTLILLNKYFDVTIYFSNDNIYPEDEYFIRLEEVKRFINELGINSIVLDDGYNAKDFYSAIKGLENLGEKSERCYSCYKLRLEKTAKRAKQDGFDFFTTTLSISPHKNDKWINEIGYELENKYNIKYLYSNFKKEEGYINSIKLSNEYGLYRQDYCGCVFSLEERKRVNGVKQENKN